MMVESFFPALLHWLDQTGQLRTAVGLDGRLQGQRLIWQGSDLLWMGDGLQLEWEALLPDLNQINPGHIGCAGGLTFFTEQISSSPRLVILGGGHLSLPIHKIGKMLGFSVIVVDDRPQFANHTRFDEADQVICASFNDALDQISNTANTYYVIVTRGHAEDATCAEILLHRDCAYIGMVGSQSKVAQTRQKLANRGFSPETITRLHAPIGLEIGGETPAEIAVSIAAEIVQIKNLVKSIELEPDLSRILRKGHTEPWIMATVIAKSGSSPRGTGSRMLINSGGLLAGTVGGGSVEFAAQSQGQSMLAAGDSFAIMTYNLTQEASAELGMICGGHIRVLFERL